jgi:hypothetical protein
VLRLRWEQRANGLENFLDLGIVRLKFAFEFFQTLTQLVVSSQNFAKHDKSPHDCDVYLYRAAAL